MLDVCMSDAAERIRSTCEWSSQQNSPASAVPERQFVRGTLSGAACSGWARREHHEVGIAGFAIRAAAEIAMGKMPFSII
jgi:hypothetical protein